VCRFGSTWVPRMSSRSGSGLLPACPAARLSARPSTARLCTQGPAPTLAEALWEVALALQTPGEHNCELGRHRSDFKRLARWILRLSTKRRNWGALASTLLGASAWRRWQPRTWMLWMKCTVCGRWPRTCVWAGRPGPLVAAARARGIPVRRLDDESLVQLGHGRQQRRIRTSVTVDRTGKLAEWISLRQGA
jgi:hypothetical protein